jgi:hypothetical protein
VFCYPCRQAFVPFDDAKVRRFLEPAKTFHVLCAQTALFFDANQRLDLAQAIPIPIYINKHKES